MAVIFVTKVRKKRIVENFFLKIIIDLGDGKLTCSRRYSYQQPEKIRENQ
jgi:hypothetical protein